MEHDGVRGARRGRESRDARKSGGGPATGQTVATGVSGEAPEAVRKGHTKHRVARPQWKMPSPSTLILSERGG